MKAILTAFDGKLKGEMEISYVFPILYLAMPCRLALAFEKPSFDLREPNIFKAKFEYIKHVDKETVEYELIGVE